MSSILSITPVLIILAVAVIAVTVYFFFYRKKVNDALRSGKDSESAAPEPSSITRIGMILVLIGAMLIMLTRISQLKDAMNQMQNTVNNQQNTLNSLYVKLEHLESMIEDQTGILEEFTLDFGELHPSDHTADIHISVIPKQMTSTMTAKVSVRDQIIELERNTTANGFNGSLRQDIFDLSDSNIRVILQDGEEQHTQSVEDYSLAALWQHYLPFVITSGGGETTQSGNSLKVNWQIQLDFVQKTDYCSFDKDSIRLVTEINGQITEEKDITGQIAWQDYTGFYEESLKKTYDVKESDVMRMYVTVKDSAGYTHQAEVMGYTQHPEKGIQQYTILNGDQIIYQE